MEILEKEYQERKERMDDLILKLENRDNELKRAVGQRSKALSSITDKVAKAMVGFESKGLKIDIKDDKLYITLEDRLLFANGRWEVSAEGLKALAKLSEVLEANPDVDVVVEGHTASLAYTGKNEVKDNWDLSVMRATSVVKVLLKNKNINPNHITASGKAGFDPKAAPRQDPNINSRTEIILTPKYVDIIDILSTGKNAATVDVDTQIGE
jgi:chemotaxis protein MotB